MNDSNDQTTYNLFNCAVQYCDACAITSSATGTTGTTVDSGGVPAGCYDVPPGVDDCTSYTSMPVEYDCGATPPSGHTCIAILGTAQGSSGLYCCTN